jgi:hypothetical protein
VPSRPILPTLPAPNCLTARCHQPTLSEPLNPMPYRNSGVDDAHGVLDGSFARSVFAQSRPTAHRLAQRSRAGSVAALGDLVHRACRLASGFLPTDACSAVAIGSSFRPSGLQGASTPQPLGHVRRTKKGPDIELVRALPNRIRGLVRHAFERYAGIMPLSGMRNRVPPPAAAPLWHPRIISARVLKPVPIPSDIARAVESAS